MVSGITILFAHNLLMFEFVPAFWQVEFGAIGPGRSFPIHQRFGSKMTRRKCPSDAWASFAPTTLHFELPQAWHLVILLASPTEMSHFISCQLYLSSLPDDVFCQMVISLATQRECLLYRFLLAVMPGTEPIEFVINQNWSHACQKHISFFARCIYLH